MPPRRGHNSAYPALGSIRGDEIIGRCQAGCDKEIARGEVFFTFLSPGLVCLNCRMAMESKPTG